MAEKEEEQGQFVRMPEELIEFVLAALPPKDLMRAAHGELVCLSVCLCVWVCLGVSGCVPLSLWCKRPECFFCCLSLLVTDQCAEDWPSAQSGCAS